MGSDGDVPPLRRMLEDFFHGQWIRVNIEGNKSGELWKAIT